MHLFHRESPEERLRNDAARAAADQEALAQQRSLQSLQAGGLPLHAQERVARIRGSGGQAPLFSSDLSVDEFLLTRQTGYEPMGLVSGSSVYHVGWNRWTLTGEMEAQTRALYDAAHLALSRLRQEAQGMGALGVVGTRLTLKRPDWGEKLVEVVAMGTALRARGAGPAAEPFLSDLSAQEYWSLLRAGSRPVGLAFGNSTYYMYTDWRTDWQNVSYRNQEVHKYTNALRDAQRRAFGRMHQAAHGLGAHGIVGVHIDRTLERIEREVNDVTYIDYVVEYLNWGTAILEAPAAAAIPRPQMALDLEDTARTPRSTLGSA